MKEIMKVLTVNEDVVGDCHDDLPTELSKKFVDGEYTHVAIGQQLFSVDVTEYNSGPIVYLAEYLTDIIPV